MKFKLFLFALSALLLSSCIKEEGVDREADILKLTIEDENYLTTIYNEHTRDISLVMKDTTGYYNSELTPTIEASRGAIVSPASNETVKLIEYSRLYDVEAENGGLKNYRVSVVQFVPVVMDFEDWYEVANKNKTKVYEMPTDDMWVNANPGVTMLYDANTPFPTRSSEDIRPGSEGVKSVLLETVEGNWSFANIMNIPIFAGNMFRGTFDVGQAMKDPLLTTNFGQPHPEYIGKPLKLTCWYKYKRGEEYTTWHYDPNASRDTKVIYIDEDMVDKPDLYAVLYKVPKGKEGKDIVLTGHDIQSSDRVVGKAMLTDAEDKLEWTELDLDFVYTEKVDFTKNDYKLAVVLSSSFDGANYKGSIGSVLQVDDLRIVSEYDQE